MPKEMLPIVNKPLVQYGVEEALAAGMSNIGFVTGRGKRAITDHFDISYELEHQIAGTNKESYLQEIRGVLGQATFMSTRQTEMKGLGHAILTGEPLMGDEPFGVVLSDDLCICDGDGVLTQMAKIYEKHGCSVVAVQQVPRQSLSAYGVIEGVELSPGLYRVDSMVEKPDPQDAPSDLAIIGRYILTPDIFDILRTTAPGKSGEIQITDALLQQAKKGRVLACQFKGRRFDCGSVPGFVEATNFIYEHVYQTPE